MRIVFAETEGRIALTLKPDSPFERMLLRRVGSWRGFHPVHHSLVDLPGISDETRDLEITFIAEQVPRDGR